MKTFALVALALLATVAMPVAAAEESTGICTFPTLPAGTCASASVGSTTFWYSEPTIGGTYSYTCDPYKVVCVLTPDTTWTYSSITVPWVYVSVTPWCDVCKYLVTDLDADIPPLVLA